MAAYVAIFDVLRSGKNLTLWADIVALYVGRHYYLLVDSFEAAKSAEERHNEKFPDKVAPEISGYVCDRCGREAEVPGGEAEELVSIDRLGGYCSIFGDGN